MKNILILGGLGFIGSNIILELLKDKSYSITVFDFHGMKNIFGDKIKIVYGDFNNKEDIETVFKHTKIDIVIHLISTTVPASSNDNIIYDIEANLTASVRLLNLLVKYKIQKIIFLSSGGTVYGITESESVDESHTTNPISSHGVIKLSIEKYLYLFKHLYGLNYLILRVGNPYGPYQKSNKQGIINIFLRNIIQNEKVIVRGNGNAIRDYIYSKDLALIIKGLIDKNIQNQILNIGSGHGVSINQILDILKKLNDKIVIEYTPMLNTDIPKIILNIGKIESLMQPNFSNIEEGIYLTYKYMINESNTN